MNVSKRNDCHSCQKLHGTYDQPDPAAGGEAALVSALLDGRAVGLRRLYCTHAAGAGADEPGAADAAPQGAVLRGAALTAPTTLAEFGSEDPRCSHESCGYVQFPNRPCGLIADRGCFFSRLRSDVLVMAEEPQWRRGQRAGHGAW